MNYLIKFFENIPFIKDNPAFIPWIIVAFMLAIIALDVYFLLKKHYIKFSVLLLFILSAIIYVTFYLNNIMNNKP